MYLYHFAACVNHARCRLEISSAIAESCFGRMQFAAGSEFNGVTPSSPTDLT